MSVGDAASAMDRMYRHQRHLYDVTRKFYLLGRDRLIDELAPPPSGLVMEIGCGTGRNLIAIARRHPKVRLLGLDVSREMLETARAAIARAGLADRVAVAQADATALEGDVPKADRIVISYALSMIPGWHAVVRDALDRLAPGGSLHIVDFGDQAGLPRAFRAALRRWLAAFGVIPRDGLPAFLADEARARGLVATVAAPLRGYAVLARVGAAPSRS